MAVTIRELSKRCGLSISTVSKALNGYTDISEATREAVTLAAKEIGYYPNSHARALKTKRSYNMGVLFTDDRQSGLTHAFFFPLCWRASKKKRSATDMILPLSAIIWAKAR